MSYLSVLDIRFITQQEKQLDRVLHTLFLVCSDALVSRAVALKMQVSVMMVHKEEG